MPDTSTPPQHYGAVARALHWGMALLILATWLPGISLSFFHAFLKGNDARLVGVHMSLGLTILALLAVRLAWRLASPPPPLPAAITPRLRQAVGAGHAALYALMAAVPVSGLALSGALGRPATFWDLIAIPALVEARKPTAVLLTQVHNMLALALFVAVAAHILAVVIHTHTLGRSLLWRMRSPRSLPDDEDEGAAAEPY